MREYESLTEKTKESKEIFAGKMLHVYEDEIVLPNGGEATREYVRHIGAVAIVPVTEDGNVTRSCVIVIIVLQSLKSIYSLT